MSLAKEVETTVRDTPNNLKYLEQSELARGYQELLDKGLVKKRGYTLQTIDEKHQKELEVKITYTAY